MTAISWTGAAGDGNYNNPNNWSPKQVPTASDDTTIAPAAAVTVAISGASDSVQSLKTAKVVTVAIADNSSLAVGNAATANSQLVNAGTISINANSYATSLVLNSAKVTLSGGGTVVLNNSNNAIITASAGTDVLYLTGETIAGGGQLGAGRLTLINAGNGIVDANDATQLVLNTGTVVDTNAGLFEATAGSAGLVIQSSVNQGTTGRIVAASANVYLASGARIAGGTLNSTGTGSVVVGNTATLDGTTNAVTNAGTLALSDNTTLTLLGGIVNSGTIALHGNSYNTDLIVGGASVTLTGGGSVALSTSGNNRIYGTAASNILDNVNNTIAGGGQLGAGQLTFTNGAAGVVDANAAAQLMLNTGTNTVTNAGLLEATAGGGGLAILSRVANTGTVAAAGAAVFLDSGSSIAGGTVAGTGGSAVVVLYGNTGTLDGSGAAVTLTGTVSVNDNGTLDLLGAIHNTGTIQFNANSYNTDLIAGSGTVALTGGGTIALSNAGNNRLYGSAAGNVLDNIDNTIAGGGQLGAGQLTLVNAAAGTIDANAAAQLVLNTGAGTVTNAGLLEASAGGGGLVIQSRIANTGLIAAAGANVYLDSGAAIAGGTMSSSNGASFVVLFGNTGTLDGSAGLTNSGTVTLNDNGTLDLLGTLTNQGTIALNGNSYNTDLIAGSATTTLTGGGAVALSDSLDNRIYGGAGTNTLVDVNNVIAGGGNIFQLASLVNQTTIDATGNAGIVISGITGGVQNSGLLEATGAGGLVLRGVTVLNHTTAATDGIVSAAGGNVYLQSGAVIAGGTVTSTGTASLVVQYGNTGVLDGSATSLINNGLVSVNDNGTLDLLGTIVNHGTIGLFGNSYNTDLVAGTATTTLTGNGALALSDSANNRVYGAAQADTLVNLDNTITGGGQFLQLTALVNDATIDATGNAGFTFSGLTNGIQNSGLLEATGAGGLALRGITAFDTTAGIVLASGGNVYLQNGGGIAGGTIESRGASAIVVQGGNGGTLDGSSALLTNTGAVTVNDNGNLELLGRIANRGTIGLGANSYYTSLVIGGSVTLTGGGVVALSDSANNRVYATAANGVLDNVDNTITGGGQFGLGQLELVNAGTIDATGGNALDLSVSGTATNSGLMTATGAGGLVFQTGTYSNTGTIAAGDGSHVTFASGTALTNQSGAVLTGGTYEAVDQGHGATLTFTGSAITTDAATIILSGTASAIATGTTAIEASLTTIAAHGRLQLLNGRNYTSALALNDFGTLTLAGGTLTTKSLTDRLGSTLTGFGTVASGLYSLGSIVATGGTLDLKGNDTIAGAVSGTGTLTLDHGRDAIGTTAPVTVAEIALINAATLNLTKSLSFANTFDIVGRGTVSGVGTYTNAGVFEQTGTGSATVSAAFVNNGTISVAAGGALAFTGGLTNNGVIAVNGAVADTAALTGGTLDIGPKGASATIGSAAGTGPSTVAALALAGGKLNTSGTVLTVTGDYTNTASGVGNRYNAFANVTGTIDGQGTQLTVVGVNGTTITDVNGQLTITVAPHGTASFVIENTGASGSAALRGALQTTAGGGTINGNQLSGSGVTAGNYGPIAAGGSSGVYTIAYKGGTLANEAIHIASDFANVAGLTIDIVAQAPAASAMAAMAREQVRPDLLAIHHS